MVDVMLEIMLTCAIIYFCANAICFFIEGVIDAIVRLCMHIYKHIRTFRKNNRTHQRTLGADDEP